MQLVIAQVHLLVVPVMQPSARRFSPSGSSEGLLSEALLCSRRRLSSSRSCLSGCAGLTGRECKDTAAARGGGCPRPAWPSAATRRAGLSAQQLPVKLVLCTSLHKPRVLIPLSSQRARSFHALGARHPEGFTPV